MPAERASGAMVCDVTEVLIGLNIFFLSCADIESETVVNKKAINIFEIIFIFFYLSLYKTLISG